ncbi:ABC transporter permease [Fonticella tunisiensis]|uniref:Nucleoside ABC transporter membrane protein n=1 Tax=Fonticella tunisiensis TaxID=1096341 RepID=A0A4R7K9K6_9CLOT|nr:ABC transporter permease [Fonticella tunisiensis]TDT50741.1 nucleoside ABC transporter membrane protein [Fonticella tunisiensis]
MTANANNSHNSLLNVLKSTYRTLLFPLISIIVAMFVAVLFVVWGRGVGFFEGTSLLFKAIWNGSFGSKDSLIETFVYVTPLLFTGLANAVAFKTGLFNIGVEGQFTIGVLITAILGLISGLPAIVHIPLIIVGGILAGAIWGGIPGYLKAKVGTNEVVNTIMMNFIAMYLSNYIVMGPLNKPGVASTPEIRPSAMLWRFLGENNRLNTGLFIGLLLIALVYILFWKTTIGYEIRAVGLNPYAAEYGGISIKKNMILAMVISGGIAGLGGAIYVSGIQHNAMELTGFIGYGFDGIAVALLAKSHPVGVLFASILFGALNSSAISLQLVNIPKQIVFLIQAIIIIFVAADYIYKWIGEKRKKEAMING